VAYGRLAGLISRLAATGCRSLCITGGEPLTHPDWFKILSSACLDYDFEEIVLQTNATLLDKKHAQTLASLGCGRLVVQISLDGATGNTHDRMRGMGAFGRAMRGIAALRNAAPEMVFRIAFTETRENFGEIPALLELAEQAGAQKVVGGTLVDCGRASFDTSLCPPEPRQYLDLLNLYYSDSVFRKRYRERGNISAIEWLRGKTSPARGGCDLVKKPYITAEGLIYPCLMFQSETYAARGAFERDFETVLKDAIPLWSKLKKISERRPSFLEECQACEGFEHCKGGCMGRAYAVNRDPDTPEDRCSLRHAVYRWRPPCAEKAPL
jgi:radical SAM protein with 4Fe4S-binding SPASM domain